MSKDLNDLARDDFKKVKRAYHHGGGRPSLATVIEGCLWTGALGGVGFMLVGMFFVGPDQPLSGELWLAGSLGIIGVFGILALITRSLPEI